MAGHHAHPADRGGRWRHLAFGMMGFMNESQLTTRTVDVPGARLYYEQRGTGPLLLSIGDPMSSRTGSVPASLARTS